MELNTRDKILSIKIVYYGTAMGGKTTNLQTVHRLMDKEHRTELISIATQDDRTLFFDLLPVGLGRFFGHELRLKLFTVPGQVRFDVTRRKVLAGADGIVFVADSQRSQAEGNALSLKNLRLNLLQNRIDPSAVQLVLQFNKRDLPELQSIQELEAALNEAKVPSFPAVATEGYGVMETLARAVELVVERIVTAQRLASPAEAKRAAQRARETMLAFAPPSPPVAQWGAPARAAPGKPHAVEGGWLHRASVNVADEVDLIEQAVQANLALGDHVAELKVQADRLTRRDRQVKALGQLAQLAEEADPARIQRELLGQTLDALGLARGSLLVRPASGGLAARYLAGHAVDPFTGIASPPVTSVAERLVAAGRPLRCNDILTEVFFGEPQPAAAGVFSLLFSPLRTPDGEFAGLFAYGGEPDEPFDANDGLFVEAACRIVSLARLRAGAVVDARRS